MSDQKEYERIVECEDCSRMYRAVTAGDPRSLDGLECCCGSSRFAELDTRIASAT